MILEETSTLLGYQLLDSGEGQRLEKFGPYILQKPDPSALWAKSLPDSEWQKADALYIKSGDIKSGAGGEASDEKGHWQIKNPEMPEKWGLDYLIPAQKNAHNRGESGEKISFYAKLNPFKHTGIFPEQVGNWNFIAEKILAAKQSSPQKEIKFLNLFGYTGIASVLAAKLGAQVTHLDASKPALTSAKENMLMSGLPEDAIRWILDDALKFVKREVKRGAKYDCILMDPPAFGRGAKGEVWKFNDDMPKLLAECAKLIEPTNFKFLIVNAYAVSLSALTLKNLLDDFAKTTGLQKGLQKLQIDYGELCLAEKSGRVLSTGIFARLF